MEHHAAMRSSQDGAGRSSRLTRRLLMFAVAGALLVPTLASAGEWGHNRAGWMLGLGVGGGTAGLSVDGLDNLDREGGMGGLFRVGYVIQPQVGLGLESSGWTKDQDGTRVSFSVTTAAVTFYPGAGSFYLRGGLGLASSEVAFSIGSTTNTTSESGFGVLAAAGTEWRLARTFALGPEVTFGYGSFDGFTSNYVNGNLQATWYFIPRTGE